MRKGVNGAAATYFLDGDNLLAELGPTGTTKVAEYSYYPGGLDNLHAINVGGSTNYYAHTDAIGNVRALTDGNGNVRRTYNYDEWGQLYGNSSDNLPFNGADRARWKGALWMGPELDLYYMRNRWYEPRTGRFLSEDPIGLAGGINNYAFGSGDPVGASDPSGLAMMKPTGGRAPSCWTEACQNAWNPGGDWNGDGLDDGVAFREYAWGRMLFEAAGGSLDEWHRIWDDGIMRQDPEVRDALMSLTYFGDIRVYEDYATNRLAISTEMQGNTLADGTVLEGRSMYLNRNSALFGHTSHMFRFVLAHELYHHGLILRGIPYGHEAEERSANCAAYGWTGWHPTTNYHPCF